jgi:hypothetical protein
MWHVVALYGPMGNLPSAGTVLSFWKRKNATPINSALRQSGRHFERPALALGFVSFLTFARANAEPV